MAALHLIADGIPRTRVAETAPNRANCYQSDAGRSVVLIAVIRILARSLEMLLGQKSLELPFVM